MELIRFLLWQPDGHALEQRAIELGIGAPPLDHGVELAQPEPKHRRLQGIEARDGAKLTDRVAIDETVIAQQPNTIGDRLVVGGDEAGIAHRIEDLERVGRETSDGAEGAGTPVAVARAHGLRGTLDDRKAVTLGN